MRAGQRCAHDQGFISGRSVVKIQEMTQLMRQDMDAPGRAKSSEQKTVCHGTPGDAGACLLRQAKARLGQPLKLRNEEHIDHVRVRAPPQKDGELRLVYLTFAAK
jgi:hypothetical protein